MVDITEHVPALRETIGNSKTAGSIVVASDIERAIIGLKMPEIINSVHSAGGRPVVIYSHYVDGIIPEIVDAVNKEKKPDGSPYRAVSFTGATKNRDEIMDDFRNGKIDVIVGSEPIATGVDGLQKVCSHAIVACMPWTAALDEQFVGRIYRQGMVDSDVTVDYIMTFGTGTGEDAWEWCEGRKKKLQSKKTLADGVMDGDLDEYIDNGRIHQLRPQAGSALQQIASEIEIDSTDEDDEDDEAA